MGCSPVSIPRHIQSVTIRTVSTSLEDLSLARQVCKLTQRRIRFLFFLFLLLIFLKSHRIIIRHLIDHLFPFPLVRLARSGAGSFLTCFAGSRGRRRWWSGRFERVSGYCQCSTGGNSHSRHGPCYVTRMSLKSRECGERTAKQCRDFRLQWEIIFDEYRTFFSKYFLKYQRALGIKLYSEEVCIFKDQTETKKSAGVRERTASAERRRSLLTSKQV